MTEQSTIEQLRAEIASLRKQLEIRENQLSKLLADDQQQQQQQKINESGKLSKCDIVRYSRQLILPDIGVQGQIKIKNSKILIVGVGGLGCPAAQYIVGAGCGTIGLLDYDDVEIHNLHRQILHSEITIGIPKTESAFIALKKLNSNVTIDTYNTQLTSENALKIIEKYDIVLDATDNVATRYLLNDACVMLKKPLVSGSALQFEGQLTVYNYQNGPCYRCIFPKPPPPEAVSNCSDNGVVGAVPGIIGTIQALETIKIISNIDGVLSGRLLLFDGITGQIRTVRLRGKLNNCDVCSENPILTKLIDYEEFCQMRATDKDLKLSILDANERISALDYGEIVKSGFAHTLIDVRSVNEFAMCNISGSINIPMNILFDAKQANEISTKIGQNPTYVICRRGNDSQLAVKKLQNILTNSIEPKDIIGGLHAWASTVDDSFPIY